MGPTTNGCKRPGRWPSVNARHDAPETFAGPLQRVIDPSLVERLQQQWRERSKFVHQRGSMLQRGQR